MWGEDLINLLVSAEVALDPGRNFGLWDLEGSK